MRSLGNTELQTQTQIGDATPRTKIIMMELHAMSSWHDQLLKIGFQKVKSADGAVRYCYEAANRRSSFWTKITVKEVGRPSPDSWQITYARSEIQVGLWKIHSVVNAVDVVVHNNSQKMVEEIREKIKIKPDFLQRISS